ncbi:alpha/beta hydrolase [Xanthobacter sp. TB0139]|uniref:alpha/beta hydrolase n=1 Tax=Xanthobacter sp. TB0139 TaxID=3459178 RepID=UPI004039443E
MPLHDETTPVLDGPRLPPRHGGPADSLVVLLHGYGADGRDLIDLGESWSAHMPGTAFVSPHAPQPCSEAPVGRQWFPLDALDPHELARGVEAAAPMLEAFLAQELARLNLPAERMALVGFSQGAMMALHAGLNAARPPAAIISYSGLWAGIAHPPAEAFSAPPPVLLVHGAQDEVVPSDALFASANALTNAGVPVEWHMCPDLPHGIDTAGITRGGDFLSALLGPQTFGAPPLGAHGTVH